MNCGFQLAALLCFFVLSGQTFGDKTATGTPPPATASATPGALGTCSQSTLDNNRTIREYCDSKWEEWGIIPKPALEELRPTNECVDTHEERLDTLLNGCGDAAFGLPTAVATIAAQKMIQIKNNEDKEAPLVILMGGTEEQLAAHFTNEFFRERCNGIADQRDERILHEELCFTRPNEPKKEEGCREYLARVQAAKECRSSVATRRQYRAKRAQINSQVQKVLAERSERAKMESENETHLQSVQTECGRIMNPHQSGLARLIGLPTTIRNHTFPDEEKVNRYNACVKNRTEGNPQLRDRLLKSTGSVIDHLIGKVDGLKCYSAKVRTKLACEIAIQVMTGGTLSVFARARLNKNGLSRLNVKEMSESSRNQMLRHSASLTDTERIAEVEQVLGRKLSRKERAAVLAAHGLGAKRGRGYDTLTLADLREEAKGMREAGLSIPEIDQIMRRGLAGNYAADSLGPLQGQRIRSYIDSLNLPSDRVPTLRWDKQNATMAQMDRSELDQILRATEEAAKNAVGKDANSAKTHFENLHRLSILKVSELTVRGSQTSQAARFEMTRAFATRNAFKETGGALPDTDRLVDLAVESGYFKKIQEHAGGFRGLYDPRAAGNPDRFDLATAVAKGLKHDEIYLATNRQIEELKGILVYMNGKSEADLPEYLQGLNPTQIREYIKVYRTNLQNIATKLNGR